MKDLKWWSNNFENVLGTLCVCIMVILLFAQVILRYIFSVSVPWTQEQAGIFFILSVYFGAVGAVKRKQHLRMELITEMVSKKNKIKMNILSDVIFIIFNLIITKALIQVAMNLKKYNMLTPVTQIHKWIYYTFICILFLLMTIRLVQEIIEKTKSLKQIS